MNNIFFLTVVSSRRPKFSTFSKPYVLYSYKFNKKVRIPSVRISLSAIHTLCHALAEEEGGQEDVTVCDRGRGVRRCDVTLDKMCLWIFQLTMWLKSSKKYTSETFIQRAISLPQKSIIRRACAEAVVQDMSL